jgi:hypothetical protein
MTVIVGSNPTRSAQTVQEVADLRKCLGQRRAVDVPPVPRPCPSVSARAWPGRLKYPGGGLRRPVARQEWTELPHPSRAQYGHREPDMTGAGRTQSLTAGQRALIRRGRRFRRSEPPSRRVERRVWDSNPRGRSPALPVFKTSALGRYANPPGQCGRRSSRIAQRGAAERKCRGG